jgi:hypothetical protein
MNFVNGEASKRIKTSERLYEPILKTLLGLFANYFAENGNIIFVFGL